MRFYSFGLPHRQLLAYDKEGALLVWLQRGNVGSARYELDALRATLLEVCALDDAYQKTDA